MRLLNSRNYRDVSTEGRKQQQEILSSMIRTSLALFNNTHDPSVLSTARVPLERFQEAILSREEKCPLGLEKLVA